MNTYIATARCMPAASLRFKKEEKETGRSFTHDSMIRHFVAWIAMLLYCTTTLHAQDAHLMLRSDTIHAGQTEAHWGRDSITVIDYTVESGGAATLVAGEYIGLDSAFWAQEGSDFHAYLSNPKNFTFYPKVQASPSTFYTSNTIQIDGFVGTLTASLSGGNSAVLIKNGISTGSSTVSVVAGDQLAIRARSADEGLAKTTLTVGFYKTTWIIAVVPGILENIPGRPSGYTAGAFDVNESGAATYSIPITVSPGTGGMQPDLSLAYSSQGGNGLLGMGWSLTGLSAIGRAPATLAQDGFIDGVDFDANDRLAIDGERLMQVGTFGTDGLEYRTEQNTFSRVVAYGTAGSGPERFQVWTKAGLIMEYAYTEDSRIEAGSRSEVLFWLLNKISDTKGNYLTVTYEEDTVKGAYYPLRIDYTANDEANLLPYASVRFDYESRPDSAARYIAGSMIKSIKRLKSIQSFFAEDLVRSYELNYQDTVHAAFSQLVSIRECGSDGNCFQPTVFNWKAGADTLAPETRWYYNSSNRDSNIPQWGASSGDYNKLVDMNADGLPDRVSHHDYEGGQGYGLWVEFNNGQGFDAKARWFHSSEAHANKPRWYNAGDCTNLIDMNSDGRPDRVAHYNYQTSEYGLWVALNNGNGFDAQSRWFHSSEAHANKPRWYNAGDCTNLIDMDGDGRPDRVAHYNYETSEYGLWVALNNGNGFDAQNRWFYSTQAHANKPRWYDGGNRTNLIDMNGDGRPDRVAWYNYQTSEYGLWVALNNGSGFEAQSRWFYSTQAHANKPGWYDNGNRTDLIDMNGDGLPDRVAHHNYQTNENGLWVALNTGSGFKPALRWWHTANAYGNFPTYSGSNGEYNILLDMNGDGLPDRVSYNDYFTNQGNALWVALNNGNGFNTQSRWFKSTRGEANYPVWTSGNTHYNSLIDINGDGLLDRVGHHDYNNGGGYGLWVSLNQEALPLIETITNGHGGKINIAYEPLTDSATYTKGDTAHYPRVDFQGPVHVVQSYEASNGPGRNEQSGLPLFRCEDQFAWAGFPGLSKNGYYG